MKKSFISIIILSITWMLFIYRGSIYSSEIKEIELEYAYIIERNGFMGARNYLRFIDDSLILALVDTGKGKAKIKRMIIDKDVVIKDSNNDIIINSVYPASKVLVSNTNPPLLSYIKGNSLVVSRIDKFDKYNNKDYDVVFKFSSNNTNYSYSQVVKIEDDTLGIAFYDPSSKSLNFAYKNESDNEGWRLEEIDKNGDVGQYVSACTIGGKVVLPYLDYSNGNLKIAIGTRILNKLYWRKLTLDSSKGVGSLISCFSDENEIAISYLDYNTRNVKFAISSNPSKIENWEISVVDNKGYNCYNIEIAKFDGHYFVLYHDLSNESIQLAINNGDYSRWTVIDLIKAKYAGVDSSLEIVSGQLYVTYYNLVDEAIIINKYRLNSNSVD